MKKRTIKINMLAAAAALSICMMTGCATANQTDSTASASAKSEQLSEQQESTSTTAEAKELFSERDMEQTADTSSAKSITVKDGETIKISGEGVYVVSGTATDCSIIVEAGKKEKVQLVLDGVTLTNSDYPAIYVVNADKVFVTTTDSENNLSVTGAFKADGETNTDAVIFAKDDITFNGAGTLNITSAEGNGISGKNDVKFTGGTYNITSALDAVEAKDTIAVCGGSFTVKSDKDGFHCEDSEDSAKGCVTISGGSFDITAKNDGIQGTSSVIIDDGEIKIDSAEGIEATFIQINGGTIDITASDDGINAASGAAGSQNGFGNIDRTSIGIEFTGGYTTINMASGDTDGVDSNGSLTISGGTIEVNTKGNAFDYDDEPVFTGGKIIVNGEEKSEVPEDMMGGFGGGKGGFGGGQRPEFDGEMPEGFDPSNFDGQFPEGFDGKRPDFNGEKPEGFGGRRGGRPGSSENTEKTETTDSTSDT
ncbi:MAG: carbohydrate-binding domain-containing protein [Ruminococcus sp.]|nr:carbohydrate-binding domain-containing protein [Ruminococcus sp.]